MFLSQKNIFVLKEEFSLNLMKQKKKHTFVYLKSRGKKQ